MPLVNWHQVFAKGKNPHKITCSFHLKREIESGSSAPYEKIALKTLAGTFTLPFKSTPYTIWVEEGGAEEPNGGSKAIMGGADVIRKINKYGTI